MAQSDSLKESLMTPGEMGEKMKAYRAIVTSLQPNPDQTADTRETPTIQGGATIVCKVSGEIFHSARAFALRGVVDIPELNAENENNFPSPVASDPIQNGEARLSGLEPGVYTILVILYGKGGSDPLDGAQWKTSVIEVEKDQKASVSFSF